VTALSPHFTVHEFDCHDGTVVPTRAYQALKDLCDHYLEDLRGAFGPVEVLSGYRHAAYNAAIGGARASFHIYDLRGYQYVAADVHCRRGGVRDWWEWMDRVQRRAERKRGGLGYYPQGGFIHVDNRPYLARWDGS
jgi:uncharacterized protein YcbK (DUF882 family)